MEWLWVGFMLVAFMYAIVGHAGASGYIALMVLAGLPFPEIRQTALVLNILVACLATVHFVRAGYFRKELFWPFAIFSVPFSFAGGMIQLPSATFKIILALALLFSAWRLVSRTMESDVASAPRLSLSAGIGALVGLLSGMIGVGGGIFLSPILLLMGWATPRQSAAIAAPFILVNSTAALCGVLTQQTWVLDYTLAAAALAVMSGGWVGAYLGSRKLRASAIVATLSSVMLLASWKLLHG